MSVRDDRYYDDRERSPRSRDRSEGREQGRGSRPSMISRGEGRRHEEEYSDRSPSRSRSRSGGRGRSSHEGERGWFGDPRGHSEAARRGWEDRR